MNSTNRLCLSVLPRLGPLLMLLALPLQAAQRPRLAVLTDIGGDPDDQQSLVRLMVYSNQFEIEALIASASYLPASPGFDPRETVSRWRPAFERDFARRMTWRLPAPTLSGDVAAASGSPLPSAPCQRRGMLF